LIRSRYRRDARHSHTEQRFYCFGQVPEGVLTVRFTYRGQVIRIIGAGFWRRGKQLYESGPKYTNEPLGRLEVVEDFSAPDQLVLKDDGSRSPSP